jgi:hypothetical protein
MISLVGKENRKIALLADNAPTHAVPDHEVEEEHGINFIQLSNIELIFLPANVTSVLQPLDQGTIAVYWHELVAWMLEEVSKPGNQSRSLKDLVSNFYQMMRWTRMSWTQMITGSCIRNCWHKAGILPESLMPASPVSCVERRRIGAIQRAGSAADPTPEAAVALAAEAAAVPTAAEPVAQTAAAPGDGTGVEEGVHAALDRLGVALAERASVVLAKGMLAEGHEVMSATDFVQLDGESEVFEVTSDGDILRMVSTQGKNEADSDKDTAEGFQPCTITVAQALEYAQAFSEFAMPRPDRLRAEQVNALQDARRALTKLSSTG